MNEFVASNVLIGTSPLSSEANAAIEGFAEGARREPSLARLATFLRTTFSLDLTTDPDIVSGFVSDESHLPGHADGLCRPRTLQEAAAILRTCFLCGVPVTVSAGRSNLTGSATPEGGILVSLSAMETPVFHVDEAEKTVTAPVGMILEDLRRAVLAATDSRLAYPVDPTSRSEASVGGSVACNASGFTPGAPGATRDWVAGVGVLLPSGVYVSARRGAVVSANGVFLLRDGGAEREIPVPTHVRPAIKNAGGPFSSEDGVMDFVDFIVGSEGIYGVVVDVTLRLADQPDAFLDFFFSMPSEADAVRFRMAIEAELGDLSGLKALEYFGANCRRYMDHEQQFFRGGDSVAIYIQVPVSVDTADAVAEDWFERLCRLGVDPDAILLLDNARDRARFIEARHSVPARSLEVVNRRGTYTLMTDTVVPKEHFLTFLEFTHGLLGANGVDYLAWGHLGDCHLHFSMLPERSQLEHATRLYEQIVAKSAELGGVYSGEHGTGKRKRGDFMACNGERGLAGVRRTKQALDPEMLLNRGNVISVHA